jgi:hypothetical protein
MFNAQSDLSLFTLTEETSRILRNSSDGGVSPRPGFDVLSGRVGFVLNKV